MTKLHWSRASLAIAGGLSLATACGSTSTLAPTDHLPGVDSGALDVSEVDASSDEDASRDEASSADAEDLDACVPTDVKKCRDASFIALGSKCKTKCPVHNLTCDPRFWKGECTHPCTTDAECQDTGSPGICGQDSQCHRPCSEGAKPCARTHFDCVGDPGHLYCASSFPNPHLDGGDDAGDDDGGDDGGDYVGDDGGNVMPDATTD